VLHRQQPVWLTEDLEIIKKKIFYSMKLHMPDVSTEKTLAHRKSKPVQSEEKTWITIVLLVEFCRVRSTRTTMYSFLKPSGFLE
jgi:hypothetical protein